MKKLNELLANIAILNQKAYNFHWNVKGENFMEYHKLTEQFYEGLTDLFDDVAEKVAMMGTKPIGTMAGYVKASTIKEVKEKAFTPKEITSAVIKDLDTLNKIALSVKSHPHVQPLLDEVFMFISKQRWFFNQSSK